MEKTRVLKCAHCTQTKFIISSVHMCAVQIELYLYSSSEQICTHGRGILIQLNRMYSSYSFELKNSPVFIFIRIQTKKQKRKKCIYSVQISTLVNSKFYKLIHIKKFKI